MKPYVLFGAEVSLFSGKVRSYLNYKNIPFIETCPSAKVVNQELYSNTGLRMIPVIKTPENEYIQDTTVIIDALESRFANDPVYPQSSLMKFIALYLELYADEWLLLPAMHYRWHYKRQNLWFILKEFGGVAVPDWPKPLQPFAAIVPAFYFGRLYKPVLGISKRNCFEVEAFFESFLQDFEQHLINHQFLLGGKPSIADFGFYGPMYAHLYRDPYSHKLIQAKAPRVADWVHRMTERQNHYDEFLTSESVIPEMIVKMLTHMKNTQLPILKETILRVHQRILDKPNEVLPRFLGQTEYSLDKVNEKRYVNTYAQWMLQRPVDFLSALPEAEQANIIGVFAKLGLSELTNIEIMSPIQKIKNKLYPA
jgi:glutathione S-transferase